MVNRIFLLCLVLFLSISVLECGRSSSRGGGSRSGGGGGFGKGWGSSSSSSWSKPSSSSSSWSKPSSSWGSSSGSSWSKPSSSSSSSSGSSWNKPSTSWSSGSGSSSWGSSKPSYPSSSSGLSGSGSSKPSSSWSTGSSKPSYPSSSGGLSGGGSSIPSYPSSSSGLSGSGSSKPSYPSSSSGLSGSGSSKPSSSWSTGSSNPSYPSSSSGLSGSGSSKPSYPSSSSGLSGSGNSRPNYPASTGVSYPSSIGLSGSGTSGSYKPGSTAHGYPSSNGMSGSGSHVSYPTGSGNKPYPTQPPSYRPSNSYNTNHGYGTGSYNPGYGGHSTTFIHTPNYYSTPQYVYVQEYRGSNSRYSDLLTGLTLYNLGRSHSSYNHHYYYDDYYHRRYDSPSSQYQPQYAASDKAICMLKIKENGMLQSLKVPCEIVSTFTEGSIKENDKLVNSTVCETVTTVMNTSSVPSNTISTNTVIPGLLPNGTIASVSPVTTPLPSISSSPTIFPNGTLVSAPVNVLPIISPNGTLVEYANNMSATAVLSSTYPPEVQVKSLPNNAISPFKNNSIENGTLPVNISSTSVVNGSPANSIVTSNVTSTTKNVSKCTTTVGIDPLTVKGPPVSASNMECNVEIITKNSVLRNPVDCKVLMEYSKMQEPKKDSSMLPSRSTLKQWLQKPPWWASIFVGI